LWDDLQHPPISYLGTDYQYRSADGSFNSLLHPNLGKAKTPYARTVAPKTMMSGALPDPGVIFDSVMTRKHSEPHPNKISSMLFYLASIIIHDLFRTNHDDYTISDTSSYLDLAPLYGSDQDEQNTMRTFKDGKIYPDCFSEVRLLMFPPGVGAILIMFNRFHNYACDQLALINQNGKFTPPKNKDDEAGWKRYDNDLFQTARLITCGLYINIILVDYVRTILNLNKTPSNWALNPRADINGVPVASGNQVSAEFNLVYRWHSAISDRDEKWTEEMWKDVFPNTDPYTMDWHDFIMKADKVERGLQAKKPYERPFAKLQRNKDLTLKDEDLVEILTSSIEDVANSYGANRVPPVMRVVEILGIMQARAWNVASLNEFREYFNLTKHQTFEDINPDPYVADQLKRLYDTPDQVELYIGLVTESAKKPQVPGAGLTPGFTISRAVLSDATALVRGDRFYTVDYHPKKLTNWGFTEVASDTSIDNGCMFYKLFLRALPDYFQPNSVYAHYPLTIPPEMDKVLTALGTHDKYSWERPAKIADPTIIFSYDAAKQIVEDKETFKVTWGAAMEFLMGPAAKDFMLAGDGPANAKSRQMMQNALYVEGKWEREVKEYYEQITEKLLKQKAYKLGNLNQVDIIRDVGNLTHVHFAAEVFSLPLKTEERPLGILTEQELYLVMAAVFICVFFDLDPAESFPLRQKAYAATHTLGQLVELNVQAIKTTGVFSDLFAKIFENATPLKDYGIHLIQRLLENKTDPLDVKSLVWGHIMGTAGGMTANQGQLFGQTLDFFLNGAGQVHLKDINTLAKQDTDEAFAQLMHYFLEGSRLNGETGVFRYVAKPVTIKDGDKTYNFKPGDKIMVNFRAASHDPKAFPDPEKVVLNRPIESYIHLGMGPHQCLGWRMTRVALTAMLKVIGRLDGVQAAKGDQGKVQKVLKDFPGAANEVPPDWKYHAFLTENWDQYWPFPQSKCLLPPSLEVIC
jgi:cytochrome P450